MQSHDSQDTSAIEAVMRAVIHGNRQNFTSYLKSYRDNIHHFKQAISCILKHATIEYMDNALECGEIVVEFVVQCGNYCECFQQLHAELNQLRQGQLRNDYPRSSPALRESQYGTNLPSIFPWANTTLHQTDVTNEQKAFELFDSITESHRSRRDYSQSTVWLPGPELTSPYRNSVKLMTLNVVSMLKEREDFPDAIEVASRLLTLLRNPHAR